MIESRRCGDQASRADAAERRLETDAAAERRRNANAAAGVAAGGGQAHARGHRGRGAAARSSRNARAVDGIARGAEERIDRRHAAAELVGVGLAEQHGAGAFELLHDGGVIVRNVFFEQQRAGRGAHAPGLEEILVRDGNAVHRKRPPSRCAPPASVRASRSARSRVTVTKALRSGLSLAMRDRYASASCNGVESRASASRADACAIVSEVRSAVCASRARWPMSGPDRRTARSSRRVMRSRS